MKPSRIVLIASGALGVLSFFLPFIRMKSFLYDIRLGGLTYVNGLIDLIGIDKHGTARKFFKYMFGRIFDPGSLMDFVKGLAMWFIVLGPVFFLIISARHLIRGIKDQGYDKGIVFAGIFSVLAWFFLWYGTKDMIVKINFFQKASFGYWIGLTAIIAAFSSKIVAQRLDSRLQPAADALEQEAIEAESSTEEEND